MVSAKLHRVISRGPFGLKKQINEPILERRKTGLAHIVQNKKNEILTIIPPQCDQKAKMWKNYW